MNKSKSLKALIIEKLKYWRKRYRYSSIYKNPSASNGRISHNDDMFQGDLDHYNSVGESAVLNIRKSLELAGISFEELNNILDLPCGHGRVMRQLIKYVKPGIITGCDLDEDGVNFCAREFGSTPVISNTDINKVKFNVKYDLIWVGSLFTHLNMDKFEKVMEALYNLLNKNGVFVFTAHGDYSLDIITKKPEFYGVHPADFEDIKLRYNNGFYFIPYEGSNDYGISLTPENYIYKCAENISKGNLKLLMFKHRGWDNHQDVYSYKRIN